jgi:ribosomal protein L16/L10AE
MKVHKPLKIIRQAFKKYQKGYSLGKKSIYRQKLYSLKTTAVIIAKKPTRLVKEPINSFLRIMSSIKGVHIKNHIKKFKIKKAVRVPLKFYGIFSRRANGLRMGKGKGGILETGAPVQAGKTIIRINYKFNSDYFRSKIRRAFKKLPKNEVDLFFL